MADTPPPGSRPAPPARARRSGDGPPAVGDSPPRRRSHAGRVVGAAIGVGSALGIGGGLTNPHLFSGASPTGASSVASCGGTERWNVKVANDPDAPTIAADANADTVEDLNTHTPTAMDAGGRMTEEKVQYTIHGYLAFFRHETDNDYHVVITHGGGFIAGKGQPTGNSMVVELPDPNCFSGKSGVGPTTSRFAQAIADARSEFEDKIVNLDGTHIPSNSIPVTVTGVAFYDFDHGQTGRSTPHPGVDGQQKVIELHPVTAISFDNSPEADE
jgi:hypothetical protein